MDKELEMAIRDFNNQMANFTTIKADDCEQEEDGQWVLQSHTINRRTDFYGDYYLNVDVEITARNGGSLNVYVWMDVVHKEYSQDNINLEDQMEINYTFWPDPFTIKQAINKLIKEKLTAIKSIEITL